MAANSQDWDRQKPRTSFRSLMWVQGPKYLDHLPLISPVHYQGAGPKVEQPGLELAPTWNDGLHQNTEPHIFSYMISWLSYKLCPGIYLLQAWTPFSALRSVWWKTLWASLASHLPAGLLYVFSSCLPGMFIISFLQTWLPSFKNGHIFQYFLIKARDRCSAHHFLSSC